MSKRTKNSTKGLTEDEVKEVLALFRNGQYQEATRHPETLININPSAKIIWNLLGASAARAGRLEKALKAFKKVVFWRFFLAILARLN